MSWLAVSHWTVLNALTFQSMGANHPSSAFESVNDESRGATFVYVFVRETLLMRVKSICLRPLSYSILMPLCTFFRFAVGRSWESEEVGDERSHMVCCNASIMDGCLQ